MASAIMVMGTASEVGKSVIAAGFCRLFHRMGVRVAPFKAQNMSLNSFVTADGGEMGRAQVLQAEACGVLPHVDMNPILLKPEADNRSQVIVQGKVWRRLDAKNYFAQRNELMRLVAQSYERLSTAYEVIVIEGAGSAAEVNLRNQDVVNWPVAELADARVLLVADIDRGGVFAQVLGTLDLLGPRESSRVAGTVINKFRGDPDLFADGVRFLEKRTALPVYGVIPFCRDLLLDQEDSLEPERLRSIRFQPDKANIAVVLLPHMSNFTDFNSLAAEPDVVLHFAGSPADLCGSDAIILPGSKNTLADLDDLDHRAMTAALRPEVAKGCELVGICGGYQMLGRQISDPRGIESGGSRPGLGFLDVVTELRSTKTTAQVKAEPLLGASYAGQFVDGYEIHMGWTRRTGAAPAFKIVERRDSRDDGHRRPEESEDGAVSPNQPVWGTYLHGVFDDPTFRRTWINNLRRRKGLEPRPLTVSQNVTQQIGSAMDRWTDHLQSHLDLRRLEPLMHRRKSDLSVSVKAGK